MQVYAFDETTYTGYNGTTNASGQATLTLPAGDYRFRADESGEQYWSSASNHCTVPGCTEATITVGSQALGTPAGGVASGHLLPDLSLLLLAPLAVAALGRRKRWQRLAWPLAGVLLVVAVVSSGTALAAGDGAEVQESEPVLVREPAPSGSASLTVDSAEGSNPLEERRSEEAMAPLSGLLLASALVAQPSPAHRAQSAGTITTTRVITYTYDPLNRLTKARYSTGESFEYAYDPASNRTAMTSTIDHVSRFTPYEYDAADRLTSVGGVGYTYDNVPAFAGAATC